MINIYKFFLYETTRISQILLIPIKTCSNLFKHPFPIRSVQDFRNDEREREVRMVRENGPIARHEPDGNEVGVWIFIADFSMEETWPGGGDTILLPVSGLIHADQTTRLTIPSLLSFPSRPWPLAGCFCRRRWPGIFQRRQREMGAVEPRAKYKDIFADDVTWTTWHRFEER